MKKSGPLRRPTIRPRAVATRSCTPTGPHTRRAIAQVTLTITDRILLPITTWRPLLCLPPLGGSPEVRREGAAGRPHPRYVRPRAPTCVPLRRVALVPRGRAGLSAWSYVHDGRSATILSGGRISGHVAACSVDGSSTPAPAKCRSRTSKPSPRGHRLPQVPRFVLFSCGISATYARAPLKQAST